MDETAQPTQRGAMSRRQALKTLAAAGLAAAAISLPEEWITPKVEGGVIPAHAQSSLCPIEAWAALPTLCNENTCPAGYRNLIAVYYIPTDLIPHKVSIIKDDCECYEFKTAFENPQPGAINLFVGFEDPVFPCDCSVYIRIRFTNGCAAYIYESTEKRLKLIDGKLVVE